MKDPIHAAIVITLSLANLVCAGDGGSPNAPTAVIEAGVTIVPSVVELMPGSSLALQAKVFDATGNLVSSPVVQWKTTNSSVASVTASGVVTGIAVGTASIVASSNGASDTALVRVTPQPPAGAYIDVFSELAYQEMLGWEEPPR
jgi:uncharacterized protein YjdB